MPAPSAEIDRRALQRRTLRVVVLCQILGGAGLAAGLTTGALLAAEMLGSEDYAGLPIAALTIGAALSAFLVGRLAQSRGRRVGLAAGFAAGALGAVGVVVAAVGDQVVLLFIALAFYGAGTATNLQARYAGTDLAEPDERGRAVSIALVSTTLGAVAGPNLVEPLGALAENLSIPPLAGPFLLGAVAYAGAGLVLWALLRPDPLLVANEASRAARADEPARALALDAEGTARLDRGVAVGAGVMVLTQVAMVAIMTMTPVHMRAHDFGLGDVGLVISIHIGAMYFPSLITGVLVDRVGRVPMAIAAAATLLAAGLTAALAPPESLALLIVALGLLGLGWNFGLIAGSAILTDATTPADRARTQGAVDVLVALGASGGAAASGPIVGSAGFAVLAFAGGALSLLLIPIVLWARRTPRAPLAA
ncbi:MFS transporter [Thermoleophilia bacterium SCSIO 60948]|nr:MFS transporter [Thermoleophilia bacterium SCSIO 60948]